MCTPQDLTHTHNAEKHLQTQGRYHGTTSSNLRTGPHLTLTHLYTLLTHTHKFTMKKNTYKRSGAVTVHPHPILTQDAPGTTASNLHAPQDTSTDKEAMAPKTGGTARAQRSVSGRNESPCGEPRHTLYTVYVESCCWGGGSRGTDGAEFRSEWWDRSGRARGRDAVFSVWYGQQGWTLIGADAESNLGLEATEHEHGVQWQYFFKRFN